MSDDLSVKRITRRGLVKTVAALSAGSCTAGWWHACSAASKTSAATPMIRSITQSIVWEGRKGGAIPTWFHPRACMVPEAGGFRALMTLQLISGSDVFGPVHWSTSSDLGQTWTDPQPIPGLGRRTIGEDYQEGGCDVVPDYHPQSGVVLAMGHNVYYRRGVLARPQGPRHPVYTVLDKKGRWSKPQKLVWDDPRGSAIYTSGCSQRIMLPDGDVLIPMSFGPKDRTDRAVASARCTFDGRTLAIRQVGGELRNPAGRGLLEPSLAFLDGRYYMTIRAEDGRGYVTSSDDGIHWTRQRPWVWDDGTPLDMSTTQQHWLVHSDGLFLVYTRKAHQNVKVFRWRAPLYVAAVDRENLRLLRDTERIVHPLVGDGVNDPNHVARMGNFHVTNASPDESWVTVGETLPHDGWHGNLLLARVRWSRPNRLAPEPF
jgi:hypothetical protein